jgi:hypothetical protein
METMSRGRQLFSVRTRSVAVRAISLPPNTSLRRALSCSALRPSSSARSRSLRRMTS